jgi:NTE family protein
MRVLVVTAAVLAAFAPADARGDADDAGVCTGETNPRPSIGLALSGGGARGAVHIGVIAALEELRVPIDCIAGTSVGAAVGGFYAAGLSVAEIQQAVRDIDWNTALFNATPRANRSFRRKQDDRLFFVNLRPGIQGGKLALPTGLVQGQIIDMILARTVIRAYDVHDFDHLPTPFRAVATDISTGRSVVLASGDLALAMRASMSLPALLTPIDVDGRMLVDGGLVMNLPVEVVQAMGGDIVVAVDASSQLLPRESMRSVVDVTGQLTTLMTIPGLERQRALLDDDDVLLTPVLDPSATFDNFARFADTIESGYLAVMEQRGRFEALALDPDGYAAYAARRVLPSTEPPIVDFVRLDNRSSIADSIIAERLDPIELGQPLDLDELETAIGQVYGLELFQNVRYRVLEDLRGRTGLEIEVDERSWGPNYLQLGMRYDASSADTRFGLAASYLRTGINEKGGEWRATLAIGDEPGLLADLYQPLGAKGWFFVEPRIDLRSSLYHAFDGDRIAATVDIRQSVLELAAGRDLHGRAEVRAGLRTASGDYHLRSGDPGLVPGDEFRRGELFVRFSFDTLDSVVFPRSGLFTAIEWRGSREEALSADQDFDQLQLAIEAAKTWGRHTLLTTLRSDATHAGDAPVHSQFRLGGFLDLSGLIRNQLTDQQAARIGLNYYRRVGNSALLPAFAGISLERGNVWRLREDMSWRGAIAAAALWAGVATPVGAVYVGAGRTDDGRSAFYLVLGGAF